MNDRRDSTPPGKVALAGLLIVAWVALLASGCAVSRLAADQIVSAPNHRNQVRTKQWAIYATNLISVMSSNPVSIIRIPVGPPRAELVALKVEPGDYHCRFAGEIGVSKGDGRRTFTLKMFPATNSNIKLASPPQTILLLHGYAMMKESMMPWALTLAQAGYRVIMVDLRGHGESTGGRIGFGMFETADLRQVLDHLAGIGLCAEQVGVMGLSYGATMALHWAAADARVRTVVAIAPYDRPDTAIGRFVEMQQVPVPARFVRRAASDAARKLSIEWQDWSSSVAMKGIEQSVLFVGGSDDPISPPADLTRMAGIGTGETKTLIVPEANHYIIGYSFAYLEKPVLEWFRTRL